MATSCEKSKTPKVGAIISDEMAIQPGLQLHPQGIGLPMFGYVDLGMEMWNTLPPKSQTSFNWKQQSSNLYY